MKRLKGSADLIFDAVEETTNLVERMHALAAKKSTRPLLMIEPLATFAQAVKTAHDATASGVYEAIRIVNKGIKKLLDIGADIAITAATDSESQETNGLATPLCSDAKGSRSWIIDHCQALLNGLYGDFLEKRENTLDLGMNFRHQGQILEINQAALAKSLPEASGKLCIFIHGLICTEWVWSISAQQFHGDATATFGSLLKKDLGYTPLYVRYNTGRHISENGQLLSDLLTQLIDEYPKEIKEIVLIGHSMGGLVARSAAHYGKTKDAPWVQKLHHIVCAGSPNLGAPLEKATNMLSSLLRAFNTPGTQAPAQILNSRSAGIKDLRFGYTIEDEWDGQDPDAFLNDHRQNVPFVNGVGYSFIAATITRDPSHPVGVLLGDLLVRVPSAAGQAYSPARRIPFSSGHVFSGMNHLHMANHPGVYKAVRQCLTASS